MTHCSDAPPFYLCHSLHTSFCRETIFGHFGGDTYQTLFSQMHLLLFRQENRHFVNLSYREDVLLFLTIPFAIPNYGERAKGQRIGSSFILAGLAGRGEFQTSTRRCCKCFLISRVRSRVRIEPHFLRTFSRTFPDQSIFVTGFQPCELH